MKNLQRSWNKSLHRIEGGLMNFGQGLSHVSSKIAGGMTRSHDDPDFNAPPEIAAVPSVVETLNSRGYREDGMGAPNQGGAAGGPILHGASGGFSGTDRVLAIGGSAMGGGGSGSGMNTMSRRQTASTAATGSLVRKPPLVLYLDLIMQHACIIDMHVHLSSERAPIRNFLAG